MAPYEDDIDDEYTDDGYDDDLPEMMCPSCRGVVTEDTQKCPHCGDWITPVDGASQGWRRWLFVIAVLLMLLAILRFAL